MEEMNKKLIAAYKLVEKQLLEMNKQLLDAYNLTNQKVDEIKNVLQEAYDPPAINANVTDKI